MSNQNVDQNEIAKFEALASRWWDPSSEFKPLHDINPLRLNFIDERVSLAGKKVLDVGCGDGLLSEGMALRGAHVTGIDMGEAPLNVARLHGLESGVKVDYRQTTIEELARNPEPGGHLFVSTINRNPKSFLFAIVGAEYVLNMLPKGTHEWKKFIRPSEMSDYLRHAGLEVRELTGMTYNPITKSYKLGRDVDVNYLMHARDIRED